MRSVIRAWPFKLNEIIELSARRSERTRVPKAELVG